MAESATPAASAANNLAVKRSVVRVILLCIVSAGLYGAYWFYVNRQLIDRELGEERSIKQSPAVQLFGPIGLGLLGGLLLIILIGIPILIAAAVLSLIVQFFIMKDIAVLQKKVGQDQYPYVWFFFGPLIASFIPFVNFFAAIAQIVIACLIVSYLNKYWDAKTSGKATNASFGGGEIAVTVAGALLWIAALIIAVVVGISGLTGAKNSDVGKAYNFGKNITKENKKAEANYEKITNDMPKTEVEALTGKPNTECAKTESEFGSYETCNYGRVIVSYTDGKVSTKTKY